MSDALRRHVTHGQTPQTEQARPDQVKNNAGGYTFQVSDRAKLNRFLTLGTEGGTFYVSERKITRDNSRFVTGLAEASAPFLVNDIVSISEAGRAPRNNSALFALAAAAGLGDMNYRQGALDVLPRVARTGYHLLVWAEYVSMFRGWGPQLVKGVRNWYLSKTPEDLAYQLLKYKQREGWAQRDLLRLVGFKGAGPRVESAHEALFRYVLKNEFNAELLPQIVDIAEQAHETTSVKDWVRLISNSRSLSREMLPSEALAQPEVWRAMVENGNLPLGAFLRNLATMTRHDVLKQMDTWTGEQLKRLTNPEAVRKARIHPIAVLIAMKTYASGHSRRGKATWTPVPQVIDALDEMFYLAFANVEPSNKRTAVCLDVSGSMSWSEAGDTGMTPRDISAAMSMVTMKAEPNHAVMAFSHQLLPLSVSPRQRLDDVIKTISQMPMGGTDCSLPMLWAIQNNVAVDTFQVYTDNETWAGRMHPHEALKQYRKHSGINARLQVIGITATDFTIADPLDPGSLDVAGFDSAVPALLADHSRGSL